MKLFFSIFLIVTAFAGSLVLVSCTAKNEQKPISIQLSAEPVTLDFSKAEDGVSMRVLGLLMSGMTKSTQDGSNEIEIAESIQYADHGKTLIVTLKDWQWSDGKSVSALDFALGIERTLNPGTASKLADLLFFIQNAMQYHQGKIKDFSKVGVRVRNPHVIEFHLVNKFTFFPEILSLSVAFPQRKDLNYHSLSLTTGPYYVESWSAEKEIKLKRNPFYPKPFYGPDTLRFVIVSDENTALRLFEKQQLDVVLRLPSIEIPTLLQNHTAKIFPYFASYYIGFSQKDPFWKNIHARRALAQAIDREEIVSLLQSGERATHSWIPEEIKGSNLNIGLPYNPQKAKEEWKLALSQSRKKTTDDITIAFDRSIRNQMLMEKVQSDLQKNLGVHVQLQSLDWKAYVQSLTQNTPSVFRFGFLSMFIDPFAHLFLFESGNPNNYTGWKSSKYDKLLRTIAVLEPNDPSRQQYVDQAQKLILEDETVIVPLFHYVQVATMSSRVQNVKLNGLGYLFFTQHEETKK